jgi:hypothetical protein
LRPRQKFAIGGGIFKGHDLGTREGFSSYTKKLVTQKFLNMSQTKLADLTPYQQKLFNEGNLYTARIKTVYDPKTKTHKLKNVFGDSNKIDVLLGDVIPEDLTNLPEELSGRGVAATKIRKKFIKEYLESLPEGEVINLDATVRKLNETIQEATNGKISITDKQILMDALESEEMNPNKVRKPKDLKEANQLFFKEKGYDVAKELVDEKAEELNKKYNLEDKGIRFRSKPTSTGKQTIALIFSGGPFKNKYNTETRPFTEQGISELEEIIKPITKTKEFKKYSSKEAQRQGSIKAGKTKVTYNQPELFQYLLEQEGPISREQVIKDFKKFGYDEGILRKAIGNLHANMYRALDPNNPRGGQFLAEVYEPNQIKNVLDKVKNNFPGDFFNRTFENLLVDAYAKDAKKYKPLADKLKKFRQLQKELKASGVGDEFIAQLDHVIPFNFLQLVREGKDPAELLRVKAYPGELNSAKFKGALDAALGRAVAQNDKKLINTINELRSFLPEDMGKLSSDGKKIIDYGAKPFNLKTMYTEQQAKFGEVYERTQNFLNNPKVISLLQNAGISLRAIGQLKKLNVPGFLNTFNKILKENPELRVELSDPYREIENQYAQLNTGTMSDVSPINLSEKELLAGTTKGEDPFPYEAALPAGVAIGQYGPQILNALKGVGKIGLKTVGSLPAAGLFAGSTIMDNLEEGKNIADAVVDPLVGIELLLPETVKSLGPLMARAARVSTPVGATITGLGTLKDRTLGMMQSADALTMQPYQENLVDEYAAKRYRGYEKGGIVSSIGRVGFADGPEDPSKRKFMKIMGGLASLPVIGRFFDIGEKAAPVVQNIFTEIQKLKNSETIMPNWFPTFLDKFRREGVAENIFKKKKVEVSKAEYDKAFAEGRGKDYYTDVARTQEYKANNPDHMDYYKLEDTDELIGTTYTNEKVPGVKVDDFDGEVSVNWENDYSQPVSIEYVKPGVIGPDMGRVDKFQAGIEKRELKPEGEFAAVDQEVYATDPDGGYDTNAIIVQSLDDMMEGTTRVMEEYATGKPVRTLSRGEGKVIEAEIRAEQAAESAAEMADDFDDF